MTDVKKACVVCASHIPINAKKCVKCQSFQGRFTRFFNTSPVVLSLLVALASVCATAIPALKSTFPKEDAIIALAYQGSTDTKLTLMFFNDGDVPGTVTNVSLRVTGFSKGYEEPLRFLLPQSSQLNWGDNQPLLVPAHTGSQVVAAIAPTPDVIDPKRGDKCVFSFVYYGSRSAGKVGQQAIDCAELSMALGLAAYQGASSRARERRSVMMATGR